MDVDTIFKSSPEQNEVAEKKKEKKMNYFYLLTILYTYFVYGLMASSFGVALTTLKSLFELSSVQVGLGLSFQSLGGCLSCVIATYTLDKWNRQLQLSFYVLFLSFLILIFPFSISPFTFYLINWLIGFSRLFIDCVANIWVVEMFRKNANTYLKILHFFYPLGAFCSPIVFGPFLKKEINPEVENFENHQIVEYFSYVSNASNENNEFILWIPYTFCSFLFLIAFLLFIISYKLQPYKEIEKSSNVETNDTNNNEIEFTNFDEEVKKPEVKSESISQKYYIFFVAIISLFAMLEVGSELNLINFLPSFLNKSELNLDAKNSAYVSSIFTLFFFIGRFLSILISHKIPTEIYLYINFALLFTGNFILVLFSQTSLKLVYIGIAIAGFGFSSTYPSMVTFVEERISLTNKISSIICFSSNIFLILSPVIISKLLEKDPTYFIYIETLTITLFIGLFVFLHIIEVLRVKKI